MKLVCTQENLSRALSYLERIVGKQSTLPILSNILIETEKGRLKLSATNLEIGVIASIGAKIEQEGKITVPAKLLGNFIHNLPVGDILEISDEGQVLIVKNEQYQGKIKGLDGRDFPIIPQFQGEGYPISFPAQELKQILGNILFCVSQNESRMELTGVNVLYRGGQFFFAATDSFRLAEQKISAPSTISFEEDQSFIVPGATFQEVLRVITPETEKIFISLEENQIFFEIDGVQIVSRLIHGKFPDYKQIIPTQFSSQFQIEKTEIVRALKIASVLSSYNSGEITVSFLTHEEKVVISSVSPEVGENRVEIKAKVLSGSENISFTFNPRYLIDGVNALSGKEMVFSANTPTTPVLLADVDENGKQKDRYVYIVMPVRK